MDGGTGLRAGQGWVVAETQGTFSRVNICGCVCLRGTQETRRSIVWMCLCECHVQVSSNGLCDQAYVSGAV